MQLETYSYIDKQWDNPFNNNLDSTQTLIIVFGDTNVENIKDGFNELKENFKNSTIIGASTSGEIYQDELQDNSLVVSVMKFDNTQIKLSTCDIKDQNSSYENGVSLANELKGDDLKAIFVLCDGLNVNGSKFVDALGSTIKTNIPITGGLAGDGVDFKSTWVIANKEIVSNKIVAVGLYGENINVLSSSQGGWDSLGIERVVTKSNDNVLYELDGMPALDIYKKYLGPKAEELPSSGLLFPLELKDSDDSKESTVRTILGVNEEENSITFAGDIPENSTVTLMKANFNSLVDGASNAATSLDLNNHKDEDILNIAISCVGRRLVLKQRTEDEIEATLDNLPSNTKQIGFYSYGEISPSALGNCDLHNQTMTLTSIWENR